MITQRLLIACSLFLTLLQAFAGDVKVSHVDAKEAAALVSNGKVTVLDVRTVEEFGEGHIKGAKNIDIMGGSFEQGLAALDKSKPYLVHCQSGGRSTRSLATFKKLGFENIIHLDGGMKGWLAAAQPVEK